MNVGQVLEERFNILSSAVSGMQHEFYRNNQDNIKY